MSRKSQTGGNTEPLPFVRKWGISIDENDDSFRTLPPVFDAADNSQHNLETHETGFLIYFF